VASAYDEPVANKKGSWQSLSDREADGPQRDFDAAIFDMDGVITKTAAVHSTAWKRMFNEYLKIRAASHHEPFKEFTHAYDYLTYVDGRPRYKGVEAFLNSRGINLPLGSPDDLPGTETICGLGNRKNVLFNQVLESEGVNLFDSTIALIEEMRQCGIKVGLATSSKNSAVVLNKTGTAHLFATVVDGVVSAKLGLKGKPEPDIFTTASANLGVPCARAIVVEDAVSGIQAGAKGGFAAVIGVARENNARELRDHGADLVVTDLGDTSVDEISRLVRAKRRLPMLHLPRYRNNLMRK
jgi:beta-phosphoglucomutase family hydrolase